MMMKKYISIFFLAAVLFVGCESPLDVKPYDKYEGEFVFSVTKKAEEYVLNTYNVLPYGNSNSNGFNRLDGGNAMIASASDEAMPNMSGSTVAYLTNGSLSPTSPNPDNTWNHNYQFIRAINLGLENLDFMPEADNALKEQYKAELIFLRAFAHFELLKRFGGIPIITRPLNVQEDLAIPRNTFAQCVDFILSECDVAIQSLLPPEEASGGNIGRISTGAAMALKSRVLLYAASPLYNGSGYDGTGNPLISYGTASEARWEEAALAAANLINLGYYELMIGTALTDDHNDTQTKTIGEKNYRDIFYTLAGNNELILIRTSALGNAVEKKNTPVGYTNGEGTTGPSQQIVDAYGMLNGRDITVQESGYDPENPYTNRDPRFYASIFHNGMQWSGRAVQTFIGGADNSTGATNATKTGYYLSKFMKGDVKIAGSETNTFHCFPIIRYAEILLNYAEAMNEAYGPDADPKGYGLTARQAVEKIRKRVLRPSDAMITTANGDKDEMRVVIQNERRVELAFEDHRHLDVRRWMIAPETLGENLKGMRITTNGDSYSYEVVSNVSERVFDTKMYLYPIPQNEINKNIAMEQNPLW